jgi:hypothetical protein
MFDGFLFTNKFRIWTRKRTEERERGFPCKKWKIVKLDFFENVLHSGFDIFQNCYKGNRKRSGIKVYETLLKLPMTQFGFLKNFEKKGKIVKLDFFFVWHSRFDIFQNSCKENRERSGKDLRNFLKTCHDAIWFFENFSKSSFLIFRIFHLLPPRIEKRVSLRVGF